VCFSTHKGNTKKADALRLSPHFFSKNRGLKKEEICL